VAKEFYEAILPSSGPYCVVGIKNKQVTQTFVNNIDELIARGEALKDEGTNAYFALASFKDASGRQASNTESLRSLFLDIDCGEGKPYPDKIAGGVALREFIDACNLPEPVVVDSGNGLHVYWPLRNSLPTADWKTRAGSLKDLCAEKKFKVDMVVVSDAARVLRMPQTLNFKGDEPLPVNVMTPVHVNGTDILDALPAPKASIMDAKAFGVDEFTRKAAAGDFPPSSFSRIVVKSLKGKGCAQIKHAVVEAETLEEPMWRAALSIAWRCVDAETAVHQLSRPHPEYTPERTLDKAQRTLGPMTCAWYRENAPERCEGCVHKITSPIQLGKKIEAAPVTETGMTVVPNVASPFVPELPFPYFRPATGGVYRKTKDKDGNVEEEKIYPYDLYVTARYYDSDEHGHGDGELINVCITSPQDGIRTFTVPVTTLLSTDRARELLVKHGVVVLDKGLKDIMAYFASAIRDLQKKSAAIRTHNQMGWTADMSGFVVGETEITATDTRFTPAALSTRPIAPLLASKGSLAMWSEIVNFYAKPGMEAHALALFFGFGAPLLKLVGGIEVKGATINLMSNESGTGKTTAQMVVNSIFGSPNGLLMRKNDTIHSKIQWMGMLNTIAATMDEVTNITDEDLSDLVYDIPQGRGRNRMESQSNRLRVNTTSWQTFLITSSNSSLYDKLSRAKSTPDGELRRLIELRINRPRDISKADTDRIFGPLQSNFGVAGPVFIQYVLNNRERCIKLVQEYQQKLDALIDNQQEDRFFSWTASCAAAGGHIALELGLHKIPLAPVIEYLVKTLRGIQAEVLRPMADRNMIAVEALSQFLTDNLSNSLVVNATKVGERNMFPIHSPRGPLMFRFEPDTNELWIVAPVLREYFTSRQIDSRAAIASMAKTGYAKNDGVATMKRIATGAVDGLSPPPARAYCFNALAFGIDKEMFEEDANTSKPEPTAG